MRCLLVSHTHWDREWYRTFQAFRARLVDAVDRVLALCAADPGYRFLLDGQSIVVEDYLAVRPERREELESLVRAGRIAIGPWYVQPDSLIPGGETHVRNLLEGRRVAEVHGRASRVGYTPDSFGHPAQLPQLLAGFGLTAFVFWRGHGDELETLPSEWRWEAPDGSSLPACHLARGYFGAAGLPGDAEAAAERLRQLALDLAARSHGDSVLLMNGVDHRLPDAHTRAAVEALAKATGFQAERGLLEDFVAQLPDELPRWRGELLGGRVANLLPGVWSSRTQLKLRNREAETALLAGAEPWAALGLALGAGDERPSLRLAWRELLQNQAHDSICGCSRDAVHEQMQARFDAALELARETTSRLQERIAGLPAERETPWSASLDLAVFNPSPHPRSDRVRFPIDPQPAMVPDGAARDGSPIHPLLAASFGAPGFTVDGEPVRCLPARENGRYALLEQLPPVDLEFVVRDVPAFGWKRVRLAPGEPSPDRLDDGRAIEAGPVAIEVDDEGTLGVRFGERLFRGLAAVEDRGDRGDSYDFDGVGEDAARLREVTVERRRHPSGLQSLLVRRRIDLPRRLAEDRDSRSEERVELPLEIEAQLVPGVERVDLRVRLDNRAEDHRLRLRFPTGTREGRCRAATTFGIAERRAGPPPATDWVHPPGSTFPHQGWLSAGGLTVVAPGLVEGEVEADGSLVLTLLRCVGWLSRSDLRTRPQPAGPGVATPGAQCPGTLELWLALLPGLDPRAAEDAERSLACVCAGDAPLHPPGQPLLLLGPRALLLSACKPAEDGRGTIVRVLNPTDGPLDASLRLATAPAAVAAVHLDESAADFEIEAREAELGFGVPAGALRSVRLLP